MAIEQVSAVAPTEAQARAIRMLSRNSKKSAQELADDLFAQVVRGRFKAKRESAAEDFGAKWDAAASIMGDDKMPLARKEYISRSLDELNEVLSEL